MSLILHESKLMNDFDPKDCPVGIANENKIDRVGDKLDMAIQRIEEKINDLKDDMNKGFSDMNDKLNNLKSRFDTYENVTLSQVEALIEKKIKENTANKVMTVIKWLIITAGGSILIAVLTKMILAALKIN